MPCKGEDQYLERNIEAALSQTYDNYRMSIVTDSQADHAYSLAKSVLLRHPTANSRIYTAEPIPKASGKVAALLTAFANESSWAEVFAFIDSDALVPPRWLGDLIKPLENELVGATTGFRWYFPSEGGFWSYVRTAWNASGTNLLFSPRYNFPWGGAMAVRTETLEKIKIKEEWAKAISDDLTLNHSFREHGFGVTFLPQCTVASFGRTSRQDFLEWAVRQITLTRFFNRGLWNYALGAYFFFNFVFLLALVSLGMYLLHGTIWAAPAVMLFTPSFVGVVRSVQRDSVFSRAMPEFSKEFRRARVGEAMASLIVPCVMTYGMIRSARTNTIQWRGRTYTLSGAKANASPRILP